MPVSFLQINGCQPATHQKLFILGFLFAGSSEEWALEPECKKAGFLFAGSSEE